MKSSELTAADIILTSSPSLVSTAISMGTISAYSHAMIYVGNGHIVEAVGEEGIRRQGLSHAIYGCDRVTVFRHANASAEHRQRIVAFAERCLEGEYASLGVVTGSGAFAAATMGLGTLTISSLRAGYNKILEHTGRKRSYFCSELVADAFLNAGLALGIYGKTPSLMNPGDISEYSDRNPGVVLKLGSIECG